MFDTEAMDEWDIPAELNLAGKGIRDEDVAASAPLVRALLVQRLEKMWRACEPQIEGVAGKPDPRFLEAGIRISDRLAKLYRLDAPVPGEDRGDGEHVDHADMVSRGLKELEARMADGSL